MDEQRSHLRLRLEGGPADRHRVSLNDLTLIASGVQTAVRNVGAVLVGQATGGGGRKLGWIEQATELVLVAPPTAGSVSLDLELASDAPTLDVGPSDLGSDALAALVSGLAEMSPGRPLPRGFDPGVLKALGTMSPVFRKGYTNIGLTLGSGQAAARADVTATRLRTTRELMLGPIFAPTKVEGVLIAVDLAGDPLTCRLDRPFLKSVTLLIPRELREIVKGLIEQDVHVDGLGEFAPGAEHPRRIEVRELTSAPGRGIERTAWRDHRPWQEHALRQGTSPLRAVEALFEDDDDLDRFLTAARGLPVE